MKVRLWGTRGSLPAAGADTVRYGGNTACVEVRLAADHLLVLDAGSGIRRLGTTVDDGVRRIDILLTHLHMDHIQGLGFFAPLFRPGTEVHIWGPPSISESLRERLTRYLSPPLFPVPLRDLPSNLTLHDVRTDGPFEVGAFTIRAALIIHPGPTVGYRLGSGGRTLAYLPDHEPALGSRTFPEPSEWLSGFDLCADADVLIHDAQYTDAEYAERIGWGHSTLAHALALASAARVHRLVTFHHDPARDDVSLERSLAAGHRTGGLELIGGREDLSLDLAG